MREINRKYITIIIIKVIIPYPIGGSATSQACLHTALLFWTLPAQTCPYPIKLHPGGAHGCSSHFLASKSAQRDALSRPGRTGQVKGKRVQAPLPLV